ncbi:hypothetical protein BDC45DRAFT_493690, partial [Circinella umbellata]
IRIHSQAFTSTPLLLSLHICSFSYTHKPPPTHTHSLSLLHFLSLISTPCLLSISFHIFTHTLSVLHAFISPIFFPIIYLLTYLV